MAAGGIPTLLLLLAIAGIALRGGAAVPVECSKDFSDLCQECGKFVLIPGPKVPPSQQCCQVVQRCNIPCVCSHITKEIGKMISAEKLAFVAKACNRPFKSGSKCGSLTVP